MAKKILLADDSITIQKVVELTFSDGDYEVIAVNNGAKAIQKLQEVRPDLILSDIIMPEKNGYEVCEFVKSHPDFKTIPVVLLTGTFEPFDPDRAERAGCDAVVTKPFESQSLIHKVEELIQQSSTGGQTPDLPESSPFDETKSGGRGSSSSSQPQTADGDPFAAESSRPSPEDLFGSTPPPSPAPSAGSSDPFGFTQDSSPAPASTGGQEQKESSGGGEAPESSFGGETTAIPKMSWADLQKLSPPPDSAATEAFTPPSSSQPESPFGGDSAGSSSFEEAAPSEPAGFGGETTAIPKMSFDDIQRAASWESEPPASSASDSPTGMAFDDAQAVRNEGESGAGARSSESSGLEWPTAAAGKEDDRASSAQAPAEEPIPSSPPPSSRESEQESSSPQMEETPWSSSSEYGKSPAMADAGAETGSSSLSDADVDRIARRVVELMSDKAVRDIAWDIIPDLARSVVRDRIRELESEG
ncbi:MAG TPA: response regulator [Thermoanaerobaculia bacterium]|nr:response regulator [Thermoanaerobaculia bacterium]